MLSVTIPTRSTPAPLALSITRNLSVTQAPRAHEVHRFVATPLVDCPETRLELLEHDTPSLYELDVDTWQRVTDFIERAASASSRP